jgi:CDP-glycerol glycerophosphotransferase
VQDKIFRKAMLDQHAIRFPAGLIYEDMDFTARALARAKQVAVVPDVAYRYLQRDAGEHTPITSRTDVAAFRDRLTIQRLMDAFFADEDLPEAKLVKDVRFLQYDLRDQLEGLPSSTPADRATVVAMAQQYLGELDDRAFERTRPAQRGVAWLVRHGHLRTLVTVLRVRRASSRVVRRAVGALPERAVARLGAPTSG